MYTTQRCFAVDMAFYLKNSHNFNKSSAVWLNWAGAIKRHMHLKVPCERSDDTIAWLAGQCSRY